MLNETLYSSHPVLSVCMLMLCSSAQWSSICSSTNSITPRHWHYQRDSEALRCSIHFGRTHLKYASLLVGNAWARHLCVFAALSSDGAPGPEVGQREHWQICDRLKVQLPLSTLSSSPNAGPPVLSNAVSAASASSAGLLRLVSSLLSGLWDAPSSLVLPRASSDGLQNACRVLSSNRVHK